MWKQSESNLLRFWTWCGIKKVHKVNGEMWNYEKYKETNYWWEAPNGKRWLEIPELTLDNLYKYAIPQIKVITMTNGFKGWVVSINQGTGKTPCYIGESKDLADAIFQAFMEVIDKETK